MEVQIAVADGGLRDEKNLVVERERNQEKKRKKRKAKGNKNWQEARGGREGWEGESAALFTCWKGKGEWWGWGWGKRNPLRNDESDQQSHDR